jgi:S1-C subfamily serine protease
MKTSRNVLVLLVLTVSVFATAQADELSDDQMQAVLELEQKRIKAIDRVLGSVIAIYGNDRSGGGSGVIIHPSGIALTNHHVITGAGVEGWGGISDGQLYKWKLIGTDPGGDVAIIQMEGRDEFPWTPLGDSDTVRVGDWALAMGNPFILSEDQSPTVTLGIVSGVNRYQPGAGQNQLEYGNCIQVDSSINPGNSGGPLFNFQGEVIGINGRGSFQDRGRVNVGLGYAISSNQIRNFIPELLATKLVEHATLDANFSNRDGKVVCSDLNLDSPVAEAGLQLGDELLQFEGEEIKTANQFTNLICTIPEDWPVSLKVRDKEGVEKSICVRAYGLPYSKPKKKKGGKPNKDKTPEEKNQEKQQNAMIELLSAPPGEVRFPEINRQYASLVLDEWRKQHVTDEAKSGSWIIKSTVNQFTKDGKKYIGAHTLIAFNDGRFALGVAGDEPHHFLFDGKSFFEGKGDDFVKLTAVEAKTTPGLMAAYGIAAPLQQASFAALGTTLIDGSDRTTDAVSWRMRVEDEDEDATFVWIEMNRDYGEYETAKTLRKIAASRDCSNEGGVLFEDFEWSHGLAIPKTRLLVSGLKEKVTHQITTVEFEWNETVDDSIFDKLPKEKVAAEPDAEESDSDEASEEKKQ